MPHLPRPGRPATRPRDPDEPHRAASPLELFFDLVFVVAVSLASAQLHHLEAEGQLAAGIGSYLMMFFAIWWAWMNFTWFATSFGQDEDWRYRVMTLVQMAGALVMAAGAPAAMAETDFTLVVAGYVVMRLAMVGQWLRVAAAVPEFRRTCLAYATGITVAQLLWVLWLFFPADLKPWTFLIFALLEITVPVLAERFRPTPWHPGHIAERYALFTLIVLGESVLASVNAVVDAAEEHEHLAGLLTTSVCGLVIAAACWWMYFAREHHEHFSRFSTALVFGYGHYLVFASAGALSAGLEIAIDHDTHATHLEANVAAAALTVPTALFLLATWFLTLRSVLRPAASAVVVALTLVVAAAAVMPHSLVVAAVGAVLVVVVLEVDRRLAPEEVRRG